MIKFNFFTLILLFTLSNSCSHRNRIPATKQDTEIKKISNGLPVYVDRQLDKISYAPIQTKALKNAKIVWINFNLMQEMGIEFPREGLTPEFEKELLDELAFMVPPKSGDSINFSSKEKLMYADRYGGYGIGRNFGSGRAASIGKLQAKGIGMTPLIGNGTSFDHSHGGASLNESIREAIWGEINHQELPLGGNRVALIIDTGTDTIWKDGTKEPRAIIWREDPLRIAHYLKAFYGTGEYERSESHRVSNNLKLIKNALPFPKRMKKDIEKLTTKEQVLIGLKEFIERISKQYAVTNSKRIFHGAASSSNIEITGRFLDYGTQSTLSDYGQAKILSHVKSFPREILDHLEETIYPTLELINQSNSNERKLFNDLLIERFSYYQRLELVNQIGFPPYLNNKLIDSKEILALGSILTSLLNDESQITNIDKEMPQQLGSGKLKKVLRALGTFDNNHPGKLLPDLIKITPNYANSLSNAFFNYQSKLQSIASNDHFSLTQLYKFKSLQFEFRNRDLKELYRSTMNETNINLIDQYKASQKTSLIWDSIDHRISNAKLTFKKLKPYEVVLNQSSTHISNTTTRLIYNVQEDRYYLDFSIYKNGNSFINFYGNNLKLTDTKNSLIRFSENNWKNFSEVEVKVKKRGIQFSIPISNPNSKIEFVMHSDNNLQWWKKNGNNIHFSFTPVQTLSCYKLFQQIL